MMIKAFFEELHTQMRLKHKKPTTQQLQARAAKGERLRALHAEYAARVHAQALVMREAASALMRLEAEIADRKEALLDGERSDQFEPVGFEPYGDMSAQLDEFDEVICPGFADIHETMQELVRHCERVLRATAQA